MTKKELEAILFTVEQGLNLHYITDTCTCDSCKVHYGPQGAPGRCARCYDAQQGEDCEDRHIYRTLRTQLLALTLIGEL